MITTSIIPLHVYGIWHSNDKRWIFGPWLPVIMKSTVLSEADDGLQKWQYDLYFVVHRTIEDASRWLLSRLKFQSMDATSDTTRSMGHFVEIDRLLGGDNGEYWAHRNGFMGAANDEPLRVDFANDPGRVRRVLEL